MIRIWKALTVLGLATAVLSSSVAITAPAVAVTRLSQTEITTTSSTGLVSITQWETGSYFATLSWDSIPGATSYRIYKTGSIRPKWRLFAMTTQKTSRTVSDRPGAIAIYRVMAMVNNREKFVDRVIYIPTR
jgi:hypothetical protein